GDVARLRDVARRDLSSSVPTCPGWTTADLVRHVAEIYLHKVAAMRLGAWPSPWPPEGIEHEEPIALLDRAYADLTGEFARRAPEEATRTWYRPDRTVGFWHRRMAQETVIHRVDAELAAGDTLAPIPDDLAVDGVDEVLTRFLDYLSKRWSEGFGDTLRQAQALPVRVAVGGSSWLVQPSPEGVDVTPDGSGSAEATVTGQPDLMLLWLWRRVDTGVTIEGSAAAVEQLRTLLRAATQ
ncbi:MAG TPA: maleylpyruvate isomerase family mycothiol-dependent enzyme, partial [Micromonosporaceae bacterium]